MPYRLKNSESLPQGLHRLVEEQMDRALLSISSASSDPEEAIHDVRKRLKECRAALRLVRDEVGSDRYQPENVALRDVGRLLSDARDSAVHVETLRRLRSEFRDGLRADTFEEIEEHLTTEHEKTVHRVLGKNGAISEVREALLAARDRVTDWPIEGDDFKTIKPSLERVHGRCCKGLDRCRDEATTEDLHDWRKRLKYLRYQMRILEDLWPGMMEAYEKALHDLTDDLGFDHDLAELESRVLEDPPSPDPGEMDILAGFVARRRAELQARALERGARCLALETDGFVSVFGALWSVTRD